MTDLGAMKRKLVQTYLGRNESARRGARAHACRAAVRTRDGHRGRQWVSSPDLETWERLHVTALMLAVAINQVLAFERRVRHLTADPELAQARASFDGVCPDAEGLRDLVSHLDAYAVGEGWRQTGRRLPPIDDQYLATFIYWGDGGSTILDLGGDHLNLRAAAEAATDLAKVIERVRARHLERVEEEANAALRRRFGLSSEAG